jgi:D-sedoheptulose 7-phosphate isomerase
MNYKSSIEAYLSKLKSIIDELSIDSINDFINILVKAREEDRTIFIMGNGGSSATASHFVCDFNKGASNEREKPFKFICLNDNIPSMMAYANDLGFEEIFAQQLKNFLKKGDVVIGISGSGNSKNIIKAIEYTNRKGGFSIGLTGYDGGRLGSLVNLHLNIPINDMQIAEDLHMVLDHCVMQILSN